MLRWRSHFSSVLNYHLPDNAPPYTGHQPRMRSNNRISTDAPSMADIIAAIKSLPRNKAAGIDGIPAEFYKANPNKAASLLQPLIHEAWANKTLPNEWTVGIIIKIPKKGNLRDCDNWRGICVLPAVSKIISKLILERIRDPLISTDDADQAGFRAGSSWTDHINSVRIIIEQCKEFRSDLHIRTHGHRCVRPTLYLLHHSRLQMSYHLYCFLLYSVML